MKTCPSETMIAALASGKIPDNQRRTLLAHIIACGQCAVKARRFDRLATMLQYARRQPDGSLQLEVPEPSFAFSQQLKETVLHNFEGKKRSLQRLRVLVKEALASAGEGFHTIGMQPAALGSRRTSRTGQMPPASFDEVELVERIQQLLPPLIAALLDPDVPASFRHQWVARLEELLLQWTKVNEDERASASSQRSNSRSTRRRMQRDKQKT